MTEKIVTVRPWRRVEPIEPGTVATNGAFAALDALRAEWQRRMKALSEEQRLANRQRSLRRLAVETGIIERLYDIEWGLTLTLVAEGLTKEVIARARGKLDDSTVATLLAQLDSLEMVLDFVRDERTLSTSFIKELHAATTRTQQYYDATDVLGRPFKKELVHGAWKTEANHVVRSDGTMLEYTPPEHIGSEMDRLIEEWLKIAASTLHPLVKSAWLHHRFVSVHPFADGNGRVARALTLLVLEKEHFAPLVVDRFHRDDYLKALDAANDGSLQSLVDLFRRLEASALTGELEGDTLQPPSSGLAEDVARTLAGQLLAAKKKRESKIQAALEARAASVHGALVHWFTNKRDALSKIFPADVKVDVFSEKPPSAKTHWFRGDVIDSARRAGHFANTDAYHAWCSLRVRIPDTQLNFVASIHGAGREPGVFAVTTFGQVRHRPDEEGQAQKSEFIKGANDAFYFVHTETPAQIEGRFDEVRALLENGLAESLARLMKEVG